MFPYLFISSGCVGARAKETVSTYGDFGTEPEKWNISLSQLKSNIKCHIFKNNTSTLSQTPVYLVTIFFLTKLQLAAAYLILPQAKAVYDVTKHIMYWYRFYFFLIFLDETLMQFSSLVSESK